MNSAPQPSPALAWYAKVVVFLAFILIFLGGLVTSWQAGMAVPDWPLSFGSLNPAGWWGNFPVRLEHGHRLFAGFVGLWIIGLSIWVFQDPGARHVRTLSVIAVIGVILQGLFGGLRVTLETGGYPHAALALRIVHGCVAQAEVCLLVALATILSPRWYSWPAFARLPRKLAWATTIAIYLQLIFGAAMRHLGAGLAIPTFPEANPDGGLMPAVHGPYTDTNFTHTRIGRTGSSPFSIILLARVIRSAGGVRRLLRPAWTLLALVAIQITLGILVIWHGKPIGLTTVHVVNGALVLATSLLLALRLSQAARHSVLSGGARA